MNHLAERILLDHPLPGCHRCVCSVSFWDLVRKRAQVNFMNSHRQIPYGTASFGSKRLWLLVAWCNEIGSTVLKSPNQSYLVS